MDHDRLLASIKLHEGYRQLPYLDSLGHWTVGYGHLLQDSLQSSVFKTVGGLLDHITDKVQHQMWLESDMAYAVGSASGWVGSSTWNKLSDERQEVLVEMCFQLGNRTRKFVKFRQAVIDGDWPQAVAEMRDSMWYSQTPGRVDDLAKKLLS